MALVIYLALYLVGSMLITLIITRLFALNKPLPDRRKYNRRREVRRGCVDRRLSYRIALDKIKQDNEMVDVLGGCPRSQTVVLKKHYFR